MTDKVEIVDLSDDIATQGSPGGGLQLVNTAPGPLATENWHTAWEQAKMLASSSMIPDRYQNKPQNVMVALESAHRLGVSPLLTMNHLYMIKGSPFWHTPFQVGLVNARAGLLKPIDWRISPENWKTGGTIEGLEVTCFATRADGVEVEESVGWKRAVREGWDKREKYQTMPIIMLKYRSAAALIRQQWPHILLGFYVDVEAEDIPAPIAADEADALPAGDVYDVTDGDDDV